MNIRHADAIRDYIRTNVLTTFNPAVAWQENEKPFTTLNEPVLYCRQEGLPVDAMIRNVSVDVYMFSKANAKNSDMNTLYTNAVAAIEYVKANPAVNDDIRISVTSDVTGEFYTGQNRRYYRFQVVCYTD